jgi:putative oxidoreductase
MGIPVGCHAFPHERNNFRQAQSNAPGVRRFRQHQVMKTNPFVGRVRSAYGLLIRGASYLQSPFLLIVRLYWGWQFFQTGKGKLSDLSQPTEFFTSLHIPFPAFNAALVATTECVGGLLLLVGLASRLISMPLIFLLCVAYLTADNEALRSIFSDPDKFLSATPFQFLFAVVIVLIFGPGAFSLDHLIGKKFGAAASTSTSPAA